MNVLKAARDEITATATSLRESETYRGEYQGDEATTAEIERLEQLAAALYAVMLTLGVE